jgi:hypothetical protein
VTGEDVGDVERDLRLVLYGLLWLGFVAVTVGIWLYG